MSPLYKSHIPFILLLLLSLPKVIYAQLEVTPSLISCQGETKKIYLMSNPKEFIYYSYNRGRPTDSLWNVTGLIIPRDSLEFEIWDGVNTAFKWPDNQYLIISELFADGTNIIGEDILNYIVDEQYHNEDAYKYPTYSFYMYMIWNNVYRQLVKGYHDKMRLFWSTTESDDEELGIFFLNIKQKNLDNYIRFLKNIKYTQYRTRVYPDFSKQHWENIPDSIINKNIRIINLWQQDTTH